MFVCVYGIDLPIYTIYMCKGSEMYINTTYTHMSQSKTCRILSLRQVDQRERWIYKNTDIEKRIAHPHALVCKNIFED